MQPLPKPHRPEQRLGDVGGSGAVYFRSPGREWGELSNFWPTEVPLPGPDSIQSRTAEHLFWALKYTYPQSNQNTRVLREYISGSSTPLKARYYAQGVPRYRLQQNRNRSERWLRQVNDRRRALCGGAPRRAGAGASAGAGTKEVGIVEADENTESTTTPEDGRLRFDGDADPAQEHPQWSQAEFRTSAMRAVINIKFHTSERARTILLMTKERPIMADLGDYELFWGCGSPESPGNNVLGNIITEWRNAFVKQQQQEQQQQEQQQQEQQQQTSA